MSTLEWRGGEGRGVCLFVEFPDRAGLQEGWVGGLEEDARD